MVINDVVIVETSKKYAINKVMRIQNSPNINLSAMKTLSISNKENTKLGGMT